MAGINSVGGYNDFSNIRGFGGLASGLDRDSLIQNMLAGTNAKVNKQQQRKTVLQWQQTAIRNITDKMIAFAEKYTATMTSSTNLFSSAFWGRNQITALGDNSKYIKVSGNLSSASSFSIEGVKQLAEKAKWSSASGVSDKVLETGDINTELQKIENLEGKTLQFEYSGTKHTVRLSGSYQADSEDGTTKAGEAYKFDTVENITNALKDIFAQEDVAGSDKLSQVISVAQDGNKIVLKADPAKVGNGVKLIGGTALGTLGFEKDSITTGGLESKELTEAELIRQVSFAEKISGKEITFNYNGVVKSFKMPKAEDLKGTDGNALTGKALMEKLEESLQSQMDEAFGRGRVSVDFTPRKDDPASDTATVFKMQFKATTPDGGDDQTSTLTLVNGDYGLLGENGIFNIEAGASNRLNLDSKVNLDVDSAKFTVNGKEVEIKKGDTYQDVIDRINKETDIEITYQKMGDKFQIVSKQDGASGRIQFGGVENEDGTVDNTGLDAIKNIFGSDIPDTNAEAITGKDAVVVVKYGDSGDEVELVRGYNSFELEGLNISVSGKFGYIENPDYDANNPNSDKLIKDPDAAAVTFDAKVDSDKVVDGIKKMVEEFNEIVALVNKEVSAKPNRDYAPLTAEEKKELSEEEIKLYEEKAKEGLLFNDSDLRGLSSELRYVISGMDQEALREIGISTSNSYSDNGKLVFDEAKFRSALESNPEKIRELFTKQAEKDASGNVTGANGMAQNMKELLDKYAKTMGATKGILIERAGSVKSPASIIKNALHSQIQQVDKKIAALQAQAKRETDRYIKQFTGLETLIAQMNNQSSWLSQFGGGY